MTRASNMHESIREMQLRERARGGGLAKGPWIGCAYHEGRHTTSATIVHPMSLTFSRCAHQCGEELIGREYAEY